MPKQDTNNLPHVYSVLYTLCIKGIHDANQNLLSASAVTHPPTTPGPPVSHGPTQLHIEDKRETKGMCFVHSTG